MSLSVTDSVLCFIPHVVVSLSVTVSVLCLFLMLS